MSDVYRALVQACERGQAGALAVVTAVKGHTPQVVGAKLLLLEDGSFVGTIGGGRVEQVVIERAREVIRSREAQTASFNLKAELGMCCGGRMDVYIEPLAATERLVLFGAGHVARPTAALAGTCGFTVQVVDEREDWNTRERFPDVDALFVEPHEDVLARLTLGPRDYVVIVTHNHDHDRDILGRVLRSDAGYIGMIGSTRKVQRTLGQLRTSGISEEGLARAHAPIGLDILAQTPEEIAVAIVGELIRHRHQGLSAKTTRGAAVDSLSESG